MCISGRDQGQDFRAVVCWGYLPKVLIFFCVVSKAGAFTERGWKNCDKKSEGSSVVPEFLKRDDLCQDRITSEHSTTAEHSTHAWGPTTSLS